MRHSQKAKIIIGTCMILVGVFTIFFLWKQFLRPSGDLAYERISMEQAVKYMRYEQGFTLLDVSPQEDYNKYHIPAAVNVPYLQLETYAKESLPDKGQMIYICSADGKESRKAANRLCELGYTNITEIGSSGDYPAALEKIWTLFPREEETG